MTLQEFSLEFDLMYNNISSNQAPGLTEYEKSVFLTQAQEALVLDLYKGVTGDSFETTEEVTRYLNTLVSTKTNISKQDNTVISIEGPTVNRNQYYIDLPDDLLFITYHHIIGDDGSIIELVPTKQEFLSKDLKNPFRGPKSTKVLCISENNKLYLYGSENLKTSIKVYFKYIRKPLPIILDKTDGFTINGRPNDSDVNTTFDCELPESLHRQILIRAVQLAKTVWQS